MWCSIEANIAVKCIPHGFKYRMARSKAMHTNEFVEQPHLLTEHLETKQVQMYISYLKQIYFVRTLLFFKIALLVL